MEYTIIFDGVNVSLRTKSGKPLKTPRIHECKEVKDVTDFKAIIRLEKEIHPGDLRLEKENSPFFTGDFAPLFQRISYHPFAAF